MRHALIAALFASTLSTVALAQQPAAKPAVPQTVKVVESQAYVFGPAIAQNTRPRPTSTSLPVRRRRPCPTS